MLLNDVIGKQGKYAIVGMNSQGKTHSLTEFYKKNKSKTIFIENEGRADEALKNNVNSSPLIEWLERLLDIKSIKKKLDQQIEKIDLSDCTKGTNLSISLDNVLANYKGLISAKIETKSNQYKQPGSGETFLGELLLVEQMINSGKKNPIKYLLIDEPETFLHSNLYMVVIGILTRLSEKMCVIVSSHSSEFVSQYIDDLGDIIFASNGVLSKLKKDNDYIEMVENMDIYDLNQPNFKKEVRLVFGDFEQYYKIFIKPKIIRCLFCRNAVFGEGLAEKILFEVFRYEYPGERFIADTEFVFLEGKYLMPAYLSIVNDIGINTVTLFDRDSLKTDPWNDKVNSYLETTATSSFSFDEDIENYLGIISNGEGKSFKPIVVPLSIQQRYIDRDKKLIQLLEILVGKIERLYE